MGLCFIIIFYIYDSKMHYIYSIPFIFRFLVLIVTSVHPATVICFPQKNGVVSLSTLLIDILWIFLWFPHCPWVWPLILISAYIWNTLLIDNIVAIYPPSEAFFWTRPLQWWQCRQWQAILQRHHISIPSSWRWRPTRQKSSRIIIRQLCSDSSRRLEHLQDLASTSLLPSMVRL